MISKLFFLSSLFLVSVALAAPPSQLGTRFPPGEDLQLQRSNSSASSVDSTHDDHRYTNSMAGAQWVQQSFNTITATFTVPTVRARRIDSGALIWVGIDGYSCDAILQVGLRIRVINGQVIYNAQYGWYPDRPHYFPVSSITSGDIITLTVTAMNSTWGLVVFGNRSRGWMISQELFSRNTLCMQDAEWIVEDFLLPDGTYIPFANFRRVTFGDAFAVGPTGRAFTPDGARLLDITRDDAHLSNTSVRTSSGGNILLTVKYGP